MGVLIFICHLSMAPNTFGRLLRFLKVCRVAIFPWFIDGNLMYSCFISHKASTTSSTASIMVVLPMLKFEAIVT